MTDELLIAEYDHWRVRHLELTPEKIQFIRERFEATRAMYSDLTMGDPLLFDIILFNRDAFWMEVVDENDIVVGLIYLTNTQWLIDADVHIVFFDRKLSEKAPLCELVIKWLFTNFVYRRLTAVIPSIYFVTIRLAKKLGFKEEGIKRESQLIGNRWVDETMLGILRSEVI